jgi:hypothetical protein
MEKTHSCGQGLAEHATVPTLVGELIDAVAENLELHMTSLGADVNARREHDAYASLSKQHRQLSAALRAVGSEMASYRELPMGAHDVAVLSTPAAAAAFERYVIARRQLEAALKVIGAADDEMLELMRAASKPS